MSGLRGHGSLQAMLGRSSQPVPKRRMDSEEDHNSQPNKVPRLALQGSDSTPASTPQTSQPKKLSVAPSRKPPTGKAAPPVQHAWDFRANKPIRRTASPSNQNGQNAPVSASDKLKPQQRRFRSRSPSPARAASMQQQQATPTMAGWVALSTRVVGLRHRLASSATAASLLCSATACTYALQQEPDNPQDPLAVQVAVHSASTGALVGMLGHLPATLAEQLCPLLDGGLVDAKVHVLCMVQEGSSSGAASEAAAAAATAAAAAEPPSSAGPTQQQQEAEQADTAPPAPHVAWLAARAASAPLTLHIRPNPALPQRQQAQVLAQIEGAKQAWETSEAGRDTGRVLREKFTLMVHELRRLDSHLFTPHELAMMRAFEQDLSQPAQSLLLRVFLRKGPWFQVEGLEERYLELQGDGCAAAAVQALLAAGFAAVPGPGEWPALLGLLPAQEAREVVASMGVAEPLSGANKSDLEALARRACGTCVGHELAAGAAEGRTRESGPAASSAPPPLSPSPTAAAADTQAAAAAAAGSEAAGAAETGAATAVAEAEAAAANGASSQAALQALLDACGHAPGEAWLRQQLQARLGPCFRVSPAARELMQRMQRVFFLNEAQDVGRFVATERGAMPYPAFVISRSCSAFESREALMAYEEALAQALELDDALQSGDLARADQCLRPAWEALDLGTHLQVRWIGGAVQREQQQQQPDAPSQQHDCPRQQQASARSPPPPPQQQQQEGDEEDDCVLVDEREGQQQQEGEDHQFGQQHGPPPQYPVAPAAEESSDDCVIVDDEHHTHASHHHNHQRVQHCHSHGHQHQQHQHTSHPQHQHQHQQHQHQHKQHQHQHQKPQQPGEHTYHHSPPQHGQQRQQDQQQQRNEGHQRDGGHPQEGIASGGDVERDPPSLHHQAACVMMVTSQANVTSQSIRAAAPGDMAPSAAVTTGPAATAAAITLTSAAAITTAVLVHAGAPTAVPGQTSTGVHTSTATTAIAIAAASATGITAAVTAATPASAERPLFLARFCAAWVHTNMATVGVSLLEKRRCYTEAAAALRRLLEGSCCPARRGDWWLRLSIDLEHNNDEEGALKAAEAALQDPWVRHGDRLALQRRVLRLGKPPRRWKRPAWAAAASAEPPEVVIEGRPIASATGLKSRFYAPDGQQVTVEQLALAHYASPEAGGWRGMHTEGGVWATLFGLIMWDVILAPVPDVFRTPFQTCPLDLETDAFYPARRDLVDRRLQEVAEGKAPDLVAACWASHRGVWCKGVHWERYSLEELLGICRCVGGLGLSVVCRLLAEDYGGWRGGMPDLLLWRPSQGDAKLVEVKGPKDRLSDAQRAWLLTLAAVDVRAEVCRVQVPKKVGGGR